MTIAMDRPRPGNMPARRRTSLLAHLAAILVLLAAAPTLGGCFTYNALTWGPPPPELSRIEIGAPKEEVEETLGSPDDQFRNVYHYSFNTEEMEAGMILLGAAVDIFTAGYTAVYAGDMKRGHRAQIRHVHIVYGPDGRVAGLSRDWADEMFRDWLLADETETEIAKLCLAARRGDGAAQYVQAIRYRYGLWNTEPDDAEALAWMKFAEFSGHPGAVRAADRLASRLDPSVAAAAEDRFRNGEMRPCPASDHDILTLKDMPSLY